MRRVLPFLVLGTSVIAAEVPALLSPQDRAALEVATVTGVAGVRPIAVQKEPHVSVSTVPVTELLRVLTLPQPNPAGLSVLTQTAPVAVLLEALVAAATEPARTDALLQAIPTNRRPDILLAVVEKLSTSVFSTNPQAGTALLPSLVNAIAPADLATVVSSLARTPERTALLAEMTRVNPKLELTLFTLDIDHWVAVHHLLGEDETPNSLYIGNWLGAWRLRLRKRIAQEGYSAEVMQEFERMKELLSKQPVNRSSGSDSAK